MEYILAAKPEGCILCIGADTSRDRERLVLHRTPLSSVMLNRYPYSNGHLMVSPLRHTAALQDLSDGELLDLMRTVRRCCCILDTVAAPQGINVGVNMGKAAGAGVDDHLHLHVVPRWAGDTNFMTVIGDLRIMPENLMTTYERLQPLFAASTGD
jgi:ATP adenylyltransferase